MQSAVMWFKVQLSNATNHNSLLQFRTDRTSRKTTDDQLQKTRICALFFFFSKLVWFCLSTFSMLPHSSCCRTRVLLHSTSKLSQSPWRESMSHGSTLTFLTFSKSCLRLHPRSWSQQNHFFRILLHTPVSSIPR